MKKNVNKVVVLLISLVLSSAVNAGFLSSLAAQKIAEKIPGSQSTSAYGGNIQQVGELKGSCPHHYPYGMPTINVEPEKIERRSFYLCEDNYAVQYDAGTKNPIWVSEVLVGYQQKNTFVQRVDNFSTNPKVPNAAQAKLGDYKGSGFDRGHQAPAADMLTDRAMEQSFYLTNMVPQVGNNMNRGIWADLEGLVRKWSVSRGRIVVVTGPVYRENVPLIGKSGVWVPSYLYKVILDPQNGDSIAFVIPNKQIITRKTKKVDSGNFQYPQTTAAEAENCGRVCTLDNFIVPVSLVEDMVGAVFFPSASVPSKMERSKMWILY